MFNIERIRFRDAPREGKPTSHLIKKIKKKLTRYIQNNTFVSYCLRLESSRISRLGGLFRFRFIKPTRIFTDAALIADAKIYHSNSRFHLFCSFSKTQIGSGLSPKIHQ